MFGIDLGTSCIRLAQYERAGISSVDITRPDGEGGDEEDDAIVKVRGDAVFIGDNIRCPVFSADNTLECVINENWRVVLDTNISVLSIVEMLQNVSVVATNVGQLYTRIGEQCRTVIHVNWIAVSDSYTRELESSVGQLYTRIGEQCRTVGHDNWIVMSDSYTGELDNSVGQLYTSILDQCRTVIRENWRAVSDSCTRELDSSVGQLYTSIVEQCWTIGHDNWIVVSDCCTR
ncbi:hypothetical protein J6590_044293 [Homalodisca vitripennis]|nr:hypothetical protein J6590_044293 [Homalodisca vitripennis]